jgi:hypothetical protein
MVILQVQVVDVSHFESECNPPIGGNGNAPHAGTVAAELMDALTRRTDYAVYVRR